MVRICKITGLLVVTTLSGVANPAPAHAKSGNKLGVIDRLRVGYEYVGGQPRAIRGIDVGGMYIVLESQVCKASSVSGYWPLVHKAFEGGWQTQISWTNPTGSTTKCATQVQVWK